MERPTGLSRSVPRATSAVVAVAYFGIALGSGGYATTAVAWGTIVLWAAVALGIAFRVWPREELSAPAILAGGCLAGLAVLSAVSLIWANDPGRAFDSILLPAGYTALFALVLLAAPATRARSWFVGLAVGIGLTTAAALAARLDPGFLGAVDRNAAFLPGAVGRLNYPIGYWNGLAACVALGMILFVWLSVVAETAAGRAAAIAMLPLGGLAIYLTSSRAGVAAVVVGVAVMVALGPKRPQLLAGAALGALATIAVVLVARGRYELVHNLGGADQRRQGLEVAAVTVLAGLIAAATRWRLDRWLAAVSVPEVIRRLALIAAALAAAGVLALGIVNAGDFSSTGQTPAASAQRSFLSGSGSGRAQFWEAGLDAFASRPFTGVGAGNYELYWNAHPKLPLVTANAHSYFLEALADLGPLGLLLALGPFAAAVVATRRRWRRPPAELGPALALMAAGGLAAAIDWTWKIPAAFAPVVIAIALLVGGAASRAGPVAVGTPRTGGRRVGAFGLGVATLAFAWGAGWIGGVVIIASGHLSTSREAAAAGQLTAAADDARAAASVEPFSPEPPIQLALVEELAGDRRAARKAALQAISKASEDWRGWAILARVDRELGAPGAAIARARAESLSPVPLPRGFLRPR